MGTGNALPISGMQTRPQNKSGKPTITVFTCKKNAKAMSLSAFLLSVAIVSGLFGLAALLLPQNVAKGYGFASTPENNYLFRVIGGMVLSAGVLNFLTRQTRDPAAIQAVLIFNLVFYTIRFSNDMLALKKGLFSWRNIYVGELIHLFILFGSLIFLIR